MKFEAIIFDCDGVLVDSEALGLQESSDYLISHGLQWTPADLVKLFTGYRDDVFYEKLRTAYRSANGTDPAPAFFEDLINIRRSRRDLLNPIEGAAEILQLNDYKIAIGSSSRTEFLEGKLKRTGLFDYAAPHIYSADRVDHGKPAPDIFLYTADKLGVLPKHCLVIEDSEAGVKAGIAAKMEVWGFLGGGHIFDGHSERLLDAGATRNVPSFNALEAALGEIGKT